MTTINGSTEIYGIIGNPVAHSLSPVIHNSAFEALDLNKVYVAFHATDAEKALAGCRALNVRGLSVTIPHKESVLAHIDSMDPMAEKIGAVNTLVFALDVGLLEAGARVVLASRTESRLKTLAEKLGCDWINLADIDTVEADVLVNATSVGMRPLETASLVSADSLERFPLVMDIVYAPLETRLLREAGNAGCETVNGLAMLLYQGAAQFEAWTEKEAPLEVMRGALMNIITE